ncbi:MerR family transcriptional regulator [Ectothiorhodospira lacustris]|uniref:MerR family transcriptional regulator n=1 Tax=Ectothiorhodospira lacustris TaxID=2899127 RepID=UPI002107D2A6|nr:MerR family transcriptional regulator [Ectothiorhodospira lacustris]
MNLAPPPRLRLPASDEGGLYPIRTVSSVTGVNAVTLRAWERRHGLIMPQRTPKGHRLYSMQDIERIQQILALLEQGISISRIHGVLSQDPPPAAPPSSPPVALKAPASRVTADVWQDYRYRMEHAVRHFSTRGLEKVYGDAVSLFPPQHVIIRLIHPLHLDLAQKTNQGGPAEAEHRFFQAWAFHALCTRLRHELHHGTGPVLGIAPLPHETDHLELLILSLLLIIQGLQVVRFSGPLSLSSLGTVSHRAALAGMVLSGRPPKNTAQVESWAIALNIPVFLAATGAEKGPDTWRGLSVYLLPEDPQAAAEQISRRLHSRNSVVQGP